MKLQHSISHNHMDIYNHLIKGTVADEVVQGFQHLSL